MEELPDKNIFMMCMELNTTALRKLPIGFTIRNCRKEELAIWKGMPFDNEADANEYAQFMENYIHTTYGNNLDLFFEKTQFVCNEFDQPIATCLIWKSYNEFNTVQWLKVIKEYEGLGIGRALLSILLKDLNKKEYPVYLHTQPGSYRAIKLYTDLGFCLLSDEIIGKRKNELKECMPILRRYLPKKDYQNLVISKAPEHFINKLKDYDTIEF